MDTNLRTTVLSAALAALFFAAPAGAARWIPTDLVLDAGASFATTGEPNGGGASLRAVPLWRVTDRFSFGVEFFADDIGTEARDMIDANDGSSRGVVAQTHRWVYGGAWRADGDLYRSRAARGGTGVEDGVRIRRGIGTCAAPYRVRNGDLYRGKRCHGASTTCAGSAGRVQWRGFRLRRVALAGPRPPWIRARCSAEFVRIATPGARSSGAGPW